MEKISKIGCIFYGIAIAEAGAHTIYYRDAPYMLLPPKHAWIPGFAVIASIFGLLLLLAGACIVFEKKARQVSLLLGGVLLLIFCFCFIPYEFMISSNYIHLADWENAEKELALAGDAFIIAGCFNGASEKSLFSFLGKLVPFGPILFSIPLISFGMLHFLLAKDASNYVPSWIPGHLFWIYFTGSALIGSGIAIILKIKTTLIAALAGLMMFTWFIILHVPRIIISPAIYMGSEISSAGLALAYSGIAFVIAGRAKNEKSL
jgi:hypothetical protein